MAKSLFSFSGIKIIQLILKTGGKGKKGGSIIIAYHFSSENKLQKHFVRIPRLPIAEGKVKSPLADGAVSLLYKIPFNFS